MEGRRLIAQQACITARFIAPFGGRPDTARVEANKSQSQDNEVTSFAIPRR
jgi:hypothetical protein